MKTKKIYLEPEIKIVDVKIPYALLAGSGSQSGLTTPTGTDWEEEIED